MANQSIGLPLFSIPGNIKQQFLPFVLNKKSPLNKAKNEEKDIGIITSASFASDTTTSPQLFTYKDIMNMATNSSGSARLNFFPYSIRKMTLDNDISFKLLYEISNSKDLPQNGRITLDTLMQHLPAVQIREFLPDTRLDQCINFFTDIFQSMSSVVTKKSDKKDDKNEEAGFWRKLLECSKYAISYMTGITSPNFYSDMDLINNMKPPFPFSSYKEEVYSSMPIVGSPENSPGFYVMTFPFTLYYRLQSCLTTNIYEIPAPTESKAIASSSGQDGWTNGGSDLMSAGGFRVSDALSKIPLVGSIANMILGNIGVNYMPWWNASNGTNTKEPEVTIKFDLFNDNFEAAMMNFIFVNTLIPNNKWVQYNMFQHSSNIYDVKIEGINRLYACAGNFNVTYDGVLRDPPRRWLDTLVRTYANENMSDSFFQNLITNKIIKIPDVYHVEMHFYSLLPANFNNFIFNFAGNYNHMTTYAGHTYDPTLGAVFGTGLGKFGKRIAEVWDKGKFDAGSKVKFK